MPGVDGSNLHSTLLPMTTGIRAVTPRAILWWGTALTTMLGDSVVDSRIRTLLSSLPPEWSV